MFLTKLSYSTFEKKNTCANRPFQKKHGWILGILFNHIIEKNVSRYIKPMINTLRHKPLKWRIRNTYMYTLLWNLRVINAQQLVVRQAGLKPPPLFSVILADNFKRVSFYKLLVRVRIHLSCCKCLVSSIAWLGVITLASRRRWANLQDTLTSTPIL